MNAAKELSGVNTNTFTITVPTGTDSAFLRKMSRKMGWKLTLCRKKKEDATLMTKEEYFAKIDKAKEQVKNGEMGPKFESATQLIEYLKAL